MNILHIVTLYYYIIVVLENKNTHLITLLLLLFIIIADYDLSKMKDFMDQQVDSYMEKGILKKDEGDVIKRIYGSM